MKTKGMEWELPADLGNRLGVHQNNVGLVTVALLIDIRDILREINGRQRAKVLIGAGENDAPIQPGTTTWKNDPAARPKKR